MALGPGEKYGGTLKTKKGVFKRAVVGPKGAVRRWEVWDGAGEERPPKVSNETVSQAAVAAEGEDGMPKGDPKVEPKPKAEGGAGGDGDAKGRNWWPWIAGAGFVVVGAAVGAALWTRRNGGLTGPGLFGRLKLVKKDAA